MEFLGMPYKDPEAAKLNDKRRKKAKKEADPIAWNKASAERTRKWRSKKSQDPVWMEKQRGLDRIRYHKDPERKRAQAQQWRKDHPERHMLLDARRRAKLRHLDFTIEVEDIIIPEFCPVLGLALTVGTGGGRKGQRPQSPTLDRINPAKGYVKGNVLVISWQANRLKNDATVSELRAILNYMESYGLS